MSGIRKYSVTIRGHRTSISLEPQFFREIEKIAAQRKIPLAALIARIDGRRDEETNLSSALRLFVLSELKSAG